MKLELSHLSEALRTPPPLNFFFLLAGCLPSAVGSLLVRCLLYFLGKKSRNQCFCTCLPSQSDFNWTQHGKVSFSFLKGTCFTSSLRLPGDSFKAVLCLCPYSAEIDTTVSLKGK